MNKLELYGLLVVSMSTFASHASIQFFQPHDVRPADTPSSSSTADNSTESTPSSETGQSDSK